MATQVIGARRRRRMRAVLVALALSSAVVVLAVQASSIWSTAVSHDPPVPAYVDPHPRTDDSPGGYARNPAFHRPAPWEIARKR
jgi:hypothetical protein